MNSVPPSVAILQRKGAGPSWTLKGTGIILSLLKNHCVGAAHLAVTKPRRAPFCFAEGDSNCGHMKHVTGMKHDTCTALHGSCGNLTALLLHDLLCLAPRLILTHVSPTRITVSLWSCHRREFRALRCRQDYGARYHGCKKLSRYPLLNCCLAPYSFHYHKSFKPDALPSWGLDKFSTQGEITGEIDTHLLYQRVVLPVLWELATFESTETRAGAQPCWAELVFSMKNGLEKNLDVSGLWFLPFLLPASSFDKLFKCFPCTRKAWGVEMFLTRQLTEVLKVWGMKVYGPAGQLTVCLTEKQTRGIQLL